jgi:hypothetical protein
MHTHVHNKTNRKSIDQLASKSIKLIFIIFGFSSTKMANVNQNNQQIKKKKKICKQEQQGITVLFDNS